MTLAAAVPGSIRRAPRKAPMMNSPPAGSPRTNKAGSSYTNAHTIRSGTASSEQALRHLLELAAAQPGRIVRLTANTAPGAELPAPLAPAAAALLSLLDSRQPLYLGPAMDHGSMHDWLRRHTSVCLSAELQHATCVLTRAADAAPELWRALDAGAASPAFLSPLNAGLLLIEVPQLQADPPPPRLEPGDTELTPRLRLQVPGRDHDTRLAVGGLGRHFWRARRRALAEHLPGLDLLLLCGDRLAALPHTTEVTLDDCA